MIEGQAFNWFFGATEGKPTVAMLHHTVMPYIFL